MDEFWDASDLGLDLDVLLDPDLLIDPDSMLDVEDFTDLDANAVELSGFAGVAGGVSSMHVHGAGTDAVDAVHHAVRDLVDKLRKSESTVRGLIGDANLETGLRARLDEFRALPHPFP